MPQKTTVALSATFTAEPLSEAVRFWLDELALPYSLEQAPYSQVFQQLLDPASLLGANRGGVNVILVRAADWSAAGAAQSAAAFTAALQAAVSRTPATWFVVECPSPGAPLEPIPGVHFIRSAEIAALYPVEEIHDPHADELGHVPYTPLYFAALGTFLARRLHALAVPPYKVLALDCDETLWRGVCGEDGPEGVTVDPPRQALQEFAVALRGRGFLLALASKNNPADVWDTFRHHASMPLRPEHLAASRIHWEPKSQSLESIAAELALSLDSIIFLDDNPREVEEVAANTPEALALALPPDAQDVPEFLRHVWAFDRFVVTEEDRQRAGMYAEEAQRAAAARQSSTLAEFIASLQLQVRIAPARADELPRLAQLTARTNQMNFSTVRRSEAELRQALAAGGLECLAVHVSDRFGSYGLSGLLLYRIDDGALRIDTFLLSCRALGRGVEHAMLAHLGALAQQRGCATVVAPYRESPRNRPALLFLEEIGRNCKRSHGFEIPAAAAAAVRYQPQSRPVLPSASTPARPAGRPALPYARIATELRTPRQVLERLRARRSRSRTASVKTPPRTELEQRLAAIWAGTLGLDEVGRDENFFDLGGHSLLAVELLGRVRRQTGASLTLEFVYGGEFTVAAMAQAIAAGATEQAAEQDYAGLLAELENLSDDEVRALLAAEEQDSTAT